MQDNPVLRCGGMMPADRRRAAMVRGPPAHGEPPGARPAAVAHPLNRSDSAGCSRALGHEPLYEPVPGLASRPRGADPGAAVAVGRAGGFPWFAVAGAEPGVARAQGGSPADRPRAHRRRHGARYRAAPTRCRGGLRGHASLEIELDRPGPAALASSADWPGRRRVARLAYAARAADALSAEAVGRRFFRQFKATLERMAEGLPPRSAARSAAAWRCCSSPGCSSSTSSRPKDGSRGRDRFLADAVDGASRGSAECPSRPAAAAVLRHAQSSARRAESGRGGVRSRPLSQWRAVRAARAGARLRRRHPEPGLA